MKKKSAVNGIFNRNLVRGAAALALLATLGLSACSPRSAQVTKVPTPTGTFTLATVDGKPVPAAVSHDGTTLQVKSGAFTFETNGTCSTKTVFVPPNGKEATREVSATYTQDGSRLSMKWEGAGTTTGTLEGNTFTMDNEGMLFVYRK